VPGRHLEGEPHEAEKRIKKELDEGPGTRMVSSQLMFASGAGIEKGGERGSLVARSLKRKVEDKSKRGDEKTNSHRTPQHYPDAQKGRGQGGLGNCKKCWWANSKKAVMDRVKQTLTKGAKGKNVETLIR